MNFDGNAKDETAKFLLECNVKFGRQQRGSWQQLSQIDDRLEIYSPLNRIRLTSLLGTNKKHTLTRVF
jgi:hypothetical protein